MNHLPILPILLPMFVGAGLLLMARSGTSVQRSISLVATLLQIPLALALVGQAGQSIEVYAAGNWAPPFGIVLVVDRLAALMLLITAVLASASVLYAIRGDDNLGRNYHALFQFQLMGINGAFLTGDLFNLFVFFEILLIASYALLLHGAGSSRVRAGLHYVLLNLFGSALFLIAVGTLYGLTGTLNMADLAVRIADTSAADAPLIGAAGMLLLIVFGLKSAMFPLYFWLPRAYAAASAPVAALFAIMTKVGLYSILRVYTLMFGEDAGPLAYLINDWLWPIGLGTVVLAAIGASASSTLNGLVAYLVVLSVGILMAGIAMGNQQALTASLYYLIHSTWVSGGLFLLAGVIARARGPRYGARLLAGPQLPSVMLFSAIFFIAAISIVGMPPLSGFIGKVLLLSSVESGGQAAWLYSVVLSSGLVVLVAMSRAGSTLFWRSEASSSAGEPVDKVRMVAVGLLLLSSPLLVIFADPLLDYLDATARQILSPAGYIEQVLSTLPVNAGGNP
ncbi:MAG TPA: monovalent cation/H+ antiporter subunit D [Pseudomonas xinjiangensis]|uniref:Monovalent cation/H+ antiporter subunit D n=2 Tax=root TaxID=1 RepID=A0A7V1BP16_9GAMM|nr:monovalent cation/H+ antiporter subunit D [Halopseudomonas xinjiangensis]HEC46290.1 monovalent cation/H+ antiporter subunit D [Halopseudomonas xinjiangensis]